jgi:ribosomal protein S20
VRRRSMMTTIALVAGLVLGIVGSPYLIGSFASAQTASPSASPSGSAQSSVGGTLRSLFLDNLAAALNMDRAALDSAITSAGNTTADQAVQQGTLTQAQADRLKERIANGDVGVLWGGRGGPGGPRITGVKEAMLDAAAQALNLSSDELITQLRDGQTVAELAQANGTTEQAVVDAALAAAKTELDAAVAAGTLTQAQADDIYTELQGRGADLLRFRGGRGDHHGRGGPGAAPVDPATPDASPSATTTSA